MHCPKRSPAKPWLSFARWGAESAEGTRLGRGDVGEKIGPLVRASRRVDPRRLARRRRVVFDQQKTSGWKLASSSAVAVVADVGEEYKKLGQMDASWNRNFFDLALAVITSMARFPDEHESSQQILHATCKMYVRYPIETEPLLRHCLNMASKDPSVDIRDRARIYGAIFAKTDSSEEEKKDARSEIEENSLR